SSDPFPSSLPAVPERRRTSSHRKKPGLRRHSLPATPDQIVSLAQLVPLLLRSGPAPQDILHITFARTCYWDSDLLPEAMTARLRPSHGDSRRGTKPGLHVPGLTHRRVRALCALPLRFSGTSRWVAHQTPRDSGT